MKIIRKNKELVLFEHNPKLVKFVDDNFWYEDESFKIICEGIIYNSCDITREYGKDSIRQCIIDIYNSTGVSGIVNKLHGSYVLAILDKNQDRLFVLNDYLSKKPIYYVNSEEIFISGTSFMEVFAMAKSQSINLEISELGVAEIINKAVFVTSDTYIKQIRFLECANYLTVSNDGVDVDIIEFEFEDIKDKSEEEIVKKIDSIFRNSCRQAAEKNAREGYRPVFSLSGGMDSRCSFLSGFEQYKSFSKEVPLCFSYGASCCEDLSIASKIADLFDCDFIANNINKANFLLDRDEILEVNEGQMYYAGTTGLRRTITRLDTSRFGLVFAGIGGGEIMGDMRIADGETTESINRAINELKKICDNVDEVNDVIPSITRYKNYNEYVDIQTIRTCLNFKFTASDRFEVFSPWLDETFYMTLISIPYKMLEKRKLYTKWYLECFKLDIPTTFEYFEGKIRMYKRTRAYRYLMSTKHLLLGLGKKWKMNPFEEWIIGSQELSMALDNMLKNDIDTIKYKYPDLAGKIQQKYEGASRGPRILNILTASGTLKWIVERI